MADWLNIDCRLQIVTYVYKGTFSRYTICFYINRYSTALPLLVTMLKMEIKDRARDMP